MPKRRASRRVSAQSKADAQKKRQNRLLFGAVGNAAIVAVVAAVVLFGGGGGTARADDFRITLYQGVAELGGAREINLASLHGKPLVLNFWAGLCPPCRAEMPGFQQFYEVFKDDVTLIGVDIGPFMRLGSHANAESLLQELHITYPAGFTDDGSVPRKYGVTSMPTTVFIKSNGEIFEKRSGALSRGNMISLATALLADEDSGEQGQGAPVPQAGAASGDN